jgi:hypothetical protein
MVENETAITRGQWQRPGEGTTLGSKQLSRIEREKQLNDVDLLAIHKAPEDYVDGKMLVLYR